MPVNANVTRQLPLTLTAQVPFPRALQFMETQAGQIHILRARRGVERAKNQAQSIRMLGLNATFGPGGEELFQSLVPKSLDRHRNQCNVDGYRSQSGYTQMEPARLLACAILSLRRAAHLQR